jgi:hypothetical protein
MSIRDQFQDLLGILEYRVEQPPDISAALPDAARKQLPIPQFTWMLLGLVSYQEQLRWAWEAVHQRLPEQVDWSLETRGELAGTVPGLPDWRYEVGWVRLDLIHNVTGERLALNLDKTPRFMLEDELVT